MGYVDYFLIVWDFVKFAKDAGIMVGPGRGSGAASIVAYCLNITPVSYTHLDVYKRQVHARMVVFVYIRGQLELQGIHRIDDDMLTCLLYTSRCV